MTSHDHAKVEQRTDLEDKKQRRSVLSGKKRNGLESTAPPAPTTATPASPATAATTASVCFLAGLVLRLGGVVHEQSIERQAVGEDVVADCGATDVDGVERDGVTALGGHLDGSEGGVHLRGDGGNGAVENGAWIELVGLGLSVESVDKGR